MFNKRTKLFILFVAVFLGYTSTGRMDLRFLWFYVQELPKAQQTVVLVLKRLRRRGNSLKSHQTDLEKPGIEPATPGLQYIGLSPTPRRLLNYLLVCGREVRRGGGILDTSFKLSTYFTEGRTNLPRVASGSLCFSRSSVSVFPRKPISVFVNFQGESPDPRESTGDFLGFYVIRNEW